MNKFHLCFLASGLCAIGGGAMFFHSFHQTKEQALVSPYSTQQIVITKDVSEPWKSLLRFGGASLSLIGGTVAAVYGIEQNRKPPVAIPQSLPYSPSLDGYSPSPLAMPTPVPQVQRQTTTPPVSPMAAPVASPQPATTSDVLTETAMFLAKTAFGGHLLFASTTGTGKTSSVLRMMELIHQEYPSAEFLVIDPKGTVWGGLDKAKIVDINLGQPLEGIEKTLDILNDLMAQLEVRKRQRKAAVEAGAEYEPTPLILILDEYPFLLKAAKDCGGVYRQEIINKIESLAFMGREDNIKLLIVSQSPYVNQLGFDGSVRTQFGIIAQGLGINAKSLKPVTDAMQDSGCLPQTISQFRLLCGRNPEHPIIFSSIGNRVELAPDLRYIKQKLIFTQPLPEMPEPEVAATEVDALAYLKQFEQSLED